MGKPRSNRIEIAAGFCAILSLGFVSGACNAGGGSTTNAGAVGSGQPAIAVSASFLEFADQPVGTTGSPQPVSVTNAGTAALAITDISIVPSQFHLISGPAVPVSLSPGDSAAFVLAFTPDAAQAFGGSLTLTTNAPVSPTVIALSGAGTTVDALAVTTIALPVATANASYLAFLKASGGTGTLSWSQSGLPPPLTWDPATGAIAGVAPAATGNNALTVQVTDAALQGASQDLTLTVAAPTGGDCDNVFVDVGDASPPPNSPGPHVAPLNDLGSGAYLGEPGGLYPNGSNEIPAEHRDAGVSLANALGPLDANGNADPAGGRMALISIGMSNASMEFSEFLADLAGDASIHPQLSIVNGAQAGFDAPTLLNPNGTYWKNIRNVILPAAGVTAKQVVAAWVKEADANPSGSFPASAQVLQADLEVIAQNLKINFPNIKLAYFSSRIYAGYATVPLSPEPSAYEGGFAVKWAIQNQVDGMALNFDPGKGAVVAPWIAWGPYLWANGLLPRSDGLVWTCQDLQPDGTHPSASGREKVAQMLIQFFKTHPTTTPWFLKH